jgi:hypothetical protein
MTETKIEMTKKQFKTINLLKILMKFKGKEFGVVIELLESAQYDLDFFFPNEKSHKNTTEIIDLILELLKELEKMN